VANLRNILWLAARSTYKGGWPGAGWPGARVGQIENAFPYHLQGANGTDQNVVSYTKRKLMISATTAKFEENVINTTARSQIRSV
jgi:hypothetical protein